MASNDNVPEGLLASLDSADYGSDDEVVLDSHMTLQSAVGGDRDSWFYRAQARAGRFFLRLYNRFSQSRAWQRILEIPPIAMVRKSLVARLTLLVAFVVVLTMGVLWIFVTTHVRDGLFDSRVEKILQDASLRTQTIQNTFDQTTVDRVDAVQDLAFQLMSAQRDAARGAGAVGIMLLHKPSSDSSLHINELIDSHVRSTLTDQMRKTVARHGGQHWQSVAIPDGDGVVPGVIVGTTLVLPVVGEYEFYIVYSLETEQSTITMINQVMWVGTFVLLIFLIVLMSMMSYQALMPIRRTAHAVKQVADGDLEVRVPVTGKDELAVLASSFNHMASELEQQIDNYQELSQLQQRFVSDVSHELRTPLSSIRIASDLLVDDIDELPAHLKRSVEILQTQVDRFDHMLADLLEVSRIDAKTAHLEEAPQDMSELVKDVISANSTLASQLGVDVHLHIFPGSHTLMGDAIRIQRILRNLIVNAYEYAEGGRVDVSVASNSQCVAVRVRDYGIGMTDEVASHVFDRFYRADPSRQRTTGGTGLGLAISAEDAALHEGIVTVLACPGEGSSFLVVLPRERGESIDALPEEIYDRSMVEARRRHAQEHPDDIWYVAEDKGESAIISKDDEDLFADVHFSEFDDDIDEPPETAPGIGLEDDQ